MRWVADKSWIYKTTFDAPVRANEKSRTDIVFKGLDTYATVTLNGYKILEADNMFVEYRIDVTDKLKPSNDLEIVFDSAYRRGYELIAEHEHEHKFLTRTTDKGRLPVRKCQCHWGWDWGPILLTAGPWRPVLLETYSSRLRDVWFEAQLSEDLKSVSGKLFADADVGNREGAKIKLSLSLDGQVAFESETEVKEDGAAAVNFDIQDPSLWHPRGYGPQTRYELCASLIIDDSEYSSQAKLVGFRKVQLIQEKDSFGQSFYFRINDVDVFAGGSCWIPGDSFIPRIGNDGYRKWVEVMADGGQIMTRYDGALINSSGTRLTRLQDLGWRHLRRRCLL